jgi:hypothetical protein
MTACDPADDSQVDTAKINHPWAWASADLDGETSPGPIIIILKIPFIRAVYAHITPGQSQSSSPVHFISRDVYANVTDARLKSVSAAAIWVQYGSSAQL